MSSVVPARRPWATAGRRRTDLRQTRWRGSCRRSPGGWTQRSTLGGCACFGKTWQAFGQVIVATALVVSYFSGPTLNFGDFSRYCRSMHDVRRGNFWGLPVNFLAFSLVTVVIVSGTLPDQRCAATIIGADHPGAARVQSVGAVAEFHWLGAGVGGGLSQGLTCTLSPRRFKAPLFSWRRSTPLTRAKLAIIASGGRA